MFKCQKRDKGQIPDRPARPGCRPANMAGPQTERPRPPCRPWPGARPATYPSPAAPRPARPVPRPGPSSGQARRTGVSDAGDDRDEFDGEREGEGKRDAARS